jgi:hypothetical protein
VLEDQQGSTRPVFGDQDSRARREAGDPAAGPATGSDAILLKQKRPARSGERPAGGNTEDKSMPARHLRGFDPATADHRIPANVQKLTGPEARRLGRLWRRIVLLTARSRKSDSWEHVRATIADIEIKGGRLAVRWRRPPDETLWAILFVVAIEDGLIPPRSQERPAAEGAPA